MRSTVPLTIRIRLRLSLFYAFPFSCVLVFIGPRLFMKIRIKCIRIAIHFHKLFSPNAKKTDHANCGYVQYDVRKQFSINSSSVFHSFVYRSQTRLWNIVTPRVDIKCLQTSWEHYLRTVFVNCSPANKRFTTTLSSRYA